MPNAELSDHICDNCGRKGALLQCGRCKHVAYCNFTCQKTGWKVHQDVCGKILPAVLDPAAPSATDVSEAVVSMSSSVSQPAFPSQSSSPRSINQGWNEKGPWLACQALRGFVTQPTLVKGQGFNTKVCDLFNARKCVDERKTAQQRTQPTVAEVDRFSNDRWNKIEDSDEDEDEDEEADRIMASQRAKLAQHLISKQSDSHTENTPKRSLAEGHRSEAATGASGSSAGVSRQRAAATRHETEQELDRLAAEVAEEAGHLGLGSIWSVGPHTEQRLRHCVHSLTSQVLPTLPEDCGALFLLGAANYLLHNASEASSADKRRFASAAKTSLLQVYNAANLSLAYQQNSLEFLAVLFQEDGDFKSSQEMLQQAAALDSGTAAAVEAGFGEASFAIARWSASRACWTVCAASRWHRRRICRSLEPGQIFLETQMPSLDELLAKLDFEDRIDNVRDN
ncbi:unnamed protein product [Polarella glacialis]|uniref:MYND-type domain-containing protein n=1 Tax=Polarella glacialis TaxID=89957 RepID=A0A813JCN4_POLGL|nr:unnamed protein product [Polarella glacialis]